jgi:hypothetical protein
MRLPVIEACLAKQLTNFLLFQIGWFICIAYGSTWSVVFLSLVLGVHFLWISHNNREWLFIVLVVSVGSAWDYIMISFDVFVPEPGYSFFIPVWLISLWCLFATTLSHSLSWLRRHYLVSAFMGAIFGPLSYWVGSNLSDVEMGEPLIRSLSILSLGWAILLPAFFLLANRLVFESKIDRKSST